MIDYMDGSGFVTPTGKAVGNGIMFSGEAYTYIESKELRDKMWNTLNDCFTDTGLKRAPGGHWATKYMAPDDLFGFGLLAHELDPALARRLLFRARKSNWMLNEHGGEWRWKSYFGRMPQLVCHLQFSADERPGVLAMTAWCIAMLYCLTKRRKSQDSYAKCWAMARVADGRNKVCDAVIAIWRVGFKSKFPGGLGQVRLEYGWDSEHPTVIELWEAY